MRIVFSRHALAQLKERKIAKNKVIDVIHHPERVTEQRSGRFRAQRTIKRGQKRYIFIVVYDMNNSDKEIVTAYFTSKLRKYQ